MSDEPLEVAHRAVDDDPAAPGGLVDVVEQVVADDGALGALAEQVGDEDVARLQLIERVLMRVGRDARLGRVGGQRAHDVGARRHELGGEGAAGHLGAGVQHLEAVGPLVAVVLARQDRPHVLGRHPLGLLDERVRNLRPAVGEAIERVVRGDLDDLLARELEELRVDQRRRQQQRRAGAQGQTHRGPPNRTTHARLLCSGTASRCAGA